MNEENIISTNKQLEKMVTLKFNIYLCIKRIIDIVVSILAFVFLIPLILIVKISYMLSGDFHSIFFNQERIGKNGKAFKMFKFRTMVPNADDLLKKLLKENKEMNKEYKKYKKLEHDPRITKMGNLLRKFSLDEFPQFINIFIGNMTLVGPRPYLFREKKDMGKYFKIVTKIKPGLTGYWQVNGRSNTDFKDRLLLDEEYIKIRGLKLDIKIIFKTFSKVLSREGAK